MVTPDDRMSIPIEQLLFWATEYIDRCVGWLSLPSETLARPEVQQILRNEDNIGHANRTALRVRAAEVARYCDRIGLRGCTAAMVRDNPFLIVMAIERQLRRLEGGRK